MRILSTLFLTGCLGEAALPPPPGGSDSLPFDTGRGEDSETGGGGDSDTAASPWADSQGPSDTGDTGEAEPESCEVVTFARLDASEVDYTAAFTDGEFITLEEEGTLTFCPGTWFVRLTLESEVSIVGLGEGPEETILSGGESGTVLTASGPKTVLSLENVTVDRGATDGIRNEQIAGGITCGDGASVSVHGAVLSNHFAYDGAAVTAKEACSLTLDDVVFFDNVAEDDGGNVRVDTSTAVFRNVRFGDGVARDCGGVFLHESDVTIEGSMFEGNVSTDSQGGALLHYYGTLTIRDSVFESNQANSVGGALALFGDTLLEGVEFRANEAYGAGGAIFVYADHGTLTCRDCSFVENVPDDVGTESGESHVFGEGADFVCDTAGCR